MAADKYSYRSWQKAPQKRRKRRTPDPILRFFRIAWRILWPLLISGAIVLIVLLAVYRYAFAHEEGLKFRNSWAFFLLPAIPIAMIVEIYLRKRLSAAMIFTR
ncbi:MAG: hypothetical protein ABIJ56_22430, partial [Pseudomonadota bacterium]